MENIKTEIEKLIKENVDLENKLKDLLKKLPVQSLLGSGAAVAEEGKEQATEANEASEDAAKEADATAEKAGNDEEQQKKKLQDLKEQNEGLKSKINDIEDELEKLKANIPDGDAKDVAEQATDKVADLANQVQQVSLSKPSIF